MKNKSEIHPRLRSSTGIKVILLNGKCIHLNYWTSGWWTPGSSTEEEGTLILWTSQKGENKRAFRKFGEVEWKEVE